MWLVLIVQFIDKETEPERGKWYAQGPLVNNWQSQPWTWFWLQSSPYSSTPHCLWAWLINCLLSHLYLEGARSARDLGQEINEVCSLDEAIYGLLNDTETCVSFMKSSVMVSRDPAVSGLLSQQDLQQIYWRFFPFHKERSLFSTIWAWPRDYFIPWDIIKHDTQAEKAHMHWDMLSCSSWNTETTMWTNQS